MYKGTDQETLGGNEGFEGSCKMSRVPSLRRALSSSDDGYCNRERNGAEYM